MKKINLWELYPDAYTTDFFVNVTEDVLETIRASERAEAAYCGSSKDTTNPLRITSMMSCRVTSEILSIIILSFISR